MNIPKYHADCCGVHVLLQDLLGVLNRVQYTSSYVYNACQQKLYFSACSPLFCVFFSSLLLACPKP